MAEYNGAGNDRVHSLSGTSEGLLSREMDELSVDELRLHENAIDKCEREASASLDLLLRNKGLRRYQDKKYSMYNLAKAMAKNFDLRVERLTKGNSSDIFVIPSSGVDVEEYDKYVLAQDPCQAIQQLKEIGRAGKIPETYNPVRIAFLKTIAHHALRMERMYTLRSSERMMKSFAAKDHESFDQKVFDKIRAPMEEAGRGFDILGLNHSLVDYQKCIEFTPRSKEDVFLEDCESQIRSTIELMRDVGMGARFGGDMQHVKETLEGCHIKLASLAKKIADAYGLDFESDTNPEFFKSLFPDGESMEFLQGEEFSPVEYLEYAGNMVGSGGIALNQINASGKVPENFNIMHVVFMRALGEILLDISNKYAESERDSIAMLGDVGGNLDIESLEKAYQEVENYSNALWILNDYVADNDSVV